MRTVENILDGRKEVLLQFWGLDGSLKLLTIYKKVRKILRNVIQNFRNFGLL